MEGWSCNEKCLRFGAAALGISLATALVARWWLVHTEYFPQAREITTDAGSGLGQVSNLNPTRRLARDGEPLSFIRFQGEPCLVP